MQALYFPFLDPAPQALSRMRRLFPKLWVLAPVELPPDTGDLAFSESELRFLRPQGLDEKFLQAMLQDFKARLHLLGKEAFLDFFSEPEEESLSPAGLAFEICGKIPEKKAREPEGIKLAMAAFFLIEAEALDRMQQELDEDLFQVDRARQRMMAALKGEEEKVIFPSPTQSACRIEARMRAWLRLARHCSGLPSFWVTDMPGLADVLETLFPVGCEERAVHGTEGFSWLSPQAKGRFFRISRAENAEILGSGFSEKAEIPPLWVACLEAESAVD